MQVYLQILYTKVHGDIFMIIYNIDKINWQLSVTSCSHQNKIATRCSTPCSKKDTLENVVLTIIKSLWTL